MSSIHLTGLKNFFFSDNSGIVDGSTMAPVTYDYDVIIIGGGSGGIATAKVSNVRTFPF